MEHTLKRITLCLVCLLNLIEIVLGDAVFELKLKDFSNPSGKDSNGHCCDSVFSTCAGVSDCDPKLQICLDDSCYWTGEYENQNSFTFGDYINNVRNPYRKLYTPRWPGSVVIKIYVEDVDSNSNDFMGKITTSFTGQPGKNNALTLYSNFDIHINVMHDHGSHTITIGAEARAFCSAYYYGDDCSKLCFPYNDSQHGYYTCSENGDKVCRENYFGPDCKTRCEPQNNDAGHYFCDVNGQKICHNGWQGYSCAQDVDECATESPCSPNGNCTNQAGTYECECQPQYTGTNCEEIKQFCDENPCGNHSIRCNNTFGGYECICGEFWRGRDCDEAPYCHSSPCSNSGVCNDTEGGYVCLCQEGWQGRNCSERITPCTSSPCLNDGICSVAGDDYKCQCVGSREGKRCQTEIRETYYDNRTVVLYGSLTPYKENEFRMTVKDLLADIGFLNCTVETESTYDNQEDLTTVLIKVSSNDPRIVGALRDIPINILAENLPLYSWDQQTEPYSKPVDAPKTSPWVKEHWYVILLVVLALVAIIVGIVLFLFIMKKRRLAKSKRSGFDHNSPVRPVDDATLDAAIGFDNSLYYEIRHPESIEGLPNGKTLD